MDYSKMKSLAADVLQRAVSAGEVAGANLLVLKDGQEVLRLCGGYADIETASPMADDSILRLYSMSKPITAAGVMLLFERGLIDLADPVSKYIPSFADQKYFDGEKLVPVLQPACIHDLLFMTSGLSYGSETPAGQANYRLFEEAISRMGGDNPMTTMEFAEKTGHNPLEFSPSQHFMYGTSADILGAVIEAVTGKRFGEFLKDELFDPLEMPDTGFYVKKEAQSRLCTAYRRTENGLEPFWNNHLAINLRMDHAPAFESGGAGLASTLTDYSHFAAMLLNNGEYKGRRIMEPATVRYFTGSSLMPHQQPDIDRWYGLGGYSYGNLMRVMRDPSRAIMHATMGEYGWDGWLGPYFSNHPGIGVTFLAGLQLTDAGTTALVRRLRNVVLPYFFEN